VIPVPWLYITLLNKSDKDGILIIKDPGEKLLSEAFRLDDIRFLQQDSTWNDLYHYFSIYLYFESSVQLQSEALSSYRVRLLYKGRQTLPYIVYSKWAI